MVTYLKSGLKIAAAVFILSWGLGCGVAERQGSSSLETVHIPTSFYSENNATQGLQIIGQASQIISSPVPFKNINRFKLSIDDGHGNLVDLAQSAPVGQAVGEIKLPYIGNPNALAPAKVIFLNDPQLQIMIDLAIPNPTGQLLQNQFNLFLMIERKSN
ncbi:MAG: hypothetical protein HY390_06170 [Deltaproteobacteria bacterium]|nr:hypothetical protein [Deltaproteobacteria bacterium]